MRGWQRQSVSLFLSFYGLAVTARCQEAPVAPASPAVPLTAIGAALARSEGVDPSSNLAYVRVFAFSAMPAAIPSPGPNSPEVGSPLDRPTLTGQCTRDGKGKLRFELFVNFGGVTDPAFYPPWRAGPHELFAPATPKIKLTLEFLGYTRVAPAKRLFEAVAAPGPAQLRYLPPGGGSSNLEPPGWFFRYLRSLPTPRVSTSGHTAEFLTTGWLDQLHKEPLCAASGA